MYHVLLMGEYIAEDDQDELPLTILVKFGNPQNSFFKEHENEAQFS